MEYGRTMQLITRTMLYLTLPMGVPGLAYLMAFPKATSLVQPTMYVEGAQIPAGESWLPWGQPDQPELPAQPDPLVRQEPQDRRVP